MRIIPYILYLFLLAFHLTIVKDITVIYGAFIDFTVLMVALVALYKGESTALWFAVCVGIIAGSVRLSLMPWEMLLLVIPAFVINQISARINLESMTSRLMIVGLFLFLHQAVIELVVSTEGYLFLLYASVLPTTIYSLVVGWIIFQMLDGHITWKKVKTLF